MNNPATLLNRLYIDARFRGLYRWVADEQRLLMLQRGLIAVLVVWAVNSMANTVWALIPSSPVEVSKSVVINPPPSTADASGGVETIDVSSILGMSVFGAAEPSEVQDLAPVNAVATPREGIENGARETSLALTLTGIVASTADGLGSAMIEARKKQELYSVGDDLPANGKVTLAKIMPKQVVIDNNGTYELITLFDDNGIVGIVQSASSELPNRTPALTAEVSTNQPERQQLAANYREQLYSDPQSLAGLVSISAVQSDGGLKGYRVAPGRDAEQFTALGFKAGDIVTAVNGYTLSDPTNTVRLYQLMRDATDATFEIERDGSPVSISVSLSSLQ
ncbi:MAG TPA: type II secretion system protein GspC [Halieaceae bacterium]|nr:type II secretion system protein GspC [Halieaceae bacterium]